MFLNVLQQRNQALIVAAIALHRDGLLPANCYVLDLDTIEENARIFSAQAQRHRLKSFAMTKQVGRHSGFCDAVRRGGIERAVAVDVACGVACKRAGLDIGHLGHLVQVPRGEADLAARRLAPDYWTVFNMEKAGEAARAARKAGRVQKILARIQSGADTFYPGHEGGFPAADIVQLADAIDALDGAEFAGITTFPALLFDGQGKVSPTPNLATLERAAGKLARAGRTDVEINAPGTTSARVLPALADAGATQCEPGNGLHGTTPLHALEELPERPAVAYLTEVSHLHGGRAYCFGGGLYIDPVFPDYDVRAVIARDADPSTHQLASVEIPPPSAIDYYAMIEAGGPASPIVGDSVVFGFRGQAFVTRAFVAGIRGVATSAPHVTTIENCFGQVETWPELV